MSYAGVQRGPEWVAWAEQETIARLSGQFSTSRAQRELRRAAAGATPTAADAEPSAQADPVDYDTFAHVEATDLELQEHPLRTHVSALSEPPDRHGSEWHQWAEAQTVLRLEQSRRARRPAPKPAAVPDIQVAGTRPRIIRINHDNLRAIGI